MYSDYPVVIKERLKLLDNVRVVLVSPKFAGNLGMSARAMKNCGLSDLRLVAPRAELNKEAYQLAPLGREVLDTAGIHDRLDQAVSDCGLVIGATRRRGLMRKNLLSPEQAADMARPALLLNKVALVFGAEDNGLSNQDLDLCHWIVSIHTASGHESFNLSHSVALICYLVNRAALAGEDAPRKFASANNLEYMFKDIAWFLVETGFIHERDPKRMMTRVRKILHRAGLSEREVRIIRGIIRQARWRMANPEAPLEPRDGPRRTTTKKT